MARRLPVIQSQGGEDAEAAERPAWHWLLLGALFVLVVFLPTSMVGLWFGATLARGAAGSAGLGAFLAGAPVLLAFAFAAWAAGAVIGRFALRATPRTAPAAASLASVALLALFVARDSAFGWPLLTAMASLLVLAGASLAWAGARFGRRLRQRS